MKKGQLCVARHGYYMNEFLTALCAAYVKSENFSGVCRFERDGRVLFEQAYGYANRSHQVPNTIDTMFDTASITKVFTAVAVLQLAEKGLLRLTDPIWLLADLTGTKIPKDITVEQLLNHTSGMADDADEEAGEDYAALFVEHPNYALRNCRDFLKNFAYKEPNFKAGTAARYCNCSFILLGLAIERVTGQSYRDYVVREIFEKAGMRRTAFCQMDGIFPNTAEGYQSIRNENGIITGYQKNIYSYPPVGTPDGGAFTTGRDLSLFLRAVQSGKLLSQEYAAMLLQPHCDFTAAVRSSIPGMTKRNGYALEFQETGGEIFCIYKDGCNAGAAGIFCYYPKQDAVLSILANQDCDVWEMRRKIQEKIYDEAT